ncbi:hypothetical protein [Mucilaginibacter sp.]|jgi:hypothetical protein|uniref:hypothetical protein n=1 Tax=Mucilaginibacter sp. TaxID=1882438 RepID=UPI003568A624
MNAEIKTTVDFKVTLELTENEARALEAIIGYGWKLFAEFFYKSLGSHYLKPYEEAAKNIFAQRQNINFQLYNIEKVREAIKSVKLNPGLEFEADKREAKPEA